MKAQNHKTLLLVLAFLLPVCVAKAVIDPHTDPQYITGWYVSSTGSLAYHGDSDVTNFSPSTNLMNVTSDHKIGFAVMLALGYCFEPWRIEIEGSHRRFRNDSNFNGGMRIDADGHVKENALMFNAYYDYDLYCWSSCLCNFSWYLGAGIGASRNELDTPLFQDADTTFAWQLMTGIAYDVNEYWALTLGYRFFATTKPDFGVYGEVDSIPYSNHVDFGIRLKF